MPIHKKTSVGITGLMGSGKSEVANYLKRTGYPVLLMDLIGHECLNEYDVVDKLTSAFGQEIIDRSQTIDRKKLGKIVFSNQKKLTLLNSILHPIMNEKAKKWIIRHYENGAFFGLHDSSTSSGKRNHQTYHSTRWKNN